MKKIFLLIASFAGTSLFAFAPVLHAQDSSVYYPYSYSYPYSTTYPYSSSYYPYPYPYPYSETMTFRARLSGANEVPQVTDSNTTGSFYMTANPSQTRAQFVLSVQNGRAITEAHLHCGAAGQTGPIVATLFGNVPGGFDAQGTLARFTLRDRNIVPNTGCSPSIANVRDLVQAAQQGRIYANIHDTRHPNGVARGQLTAYGGWYSGPFASYSPSEYYDYSNDYSSYSPPMSSGYSYDPSTGYHYDPSGAAYGQMYYPYSPSYNPAAGQIYYPPSSQGTGYYYSDPS